MSRISTCLQEDQLAKDFSQKMFQGKTRAALKLLTHEGKGGVLGLEDEVPIAENTKSVREILREKHPKLTGTP